jgi:hypothetical protein
MSYVCPNSNTRSLIDFLIKNYETFETEESFKCCVLWQLLADMVDGCERPSASTAAPEEGVHSRTTETAPAPPEATTPATEAINAATEFTAAPPEATTTATEATTAPPDAATSPAEAGSNSTELPRRRRDTQQVIQHLLDFSDPV